MIDEELVKIINDLELILKKDSRFKINDDDKYRNQMRKIYQESKYNKKPINLTGLINLNQNNTVDIGDIAYINHINNLIVQAKTKLDNIINN